MFYSSISVLGGSIEDAVGFLLMAAPRRISDFGLDIESEIGISMNPSDGEG